MSACTGTGRKVAHRKDDLVEIIEHFNVSCLMAGMVCLEQSCLFELFLHCSFYGLGNWFKLGKI